MGRCLSENSSDYRLRVPPFLRALFSHLSPSRPIPLAFYSPHATRLPLHRPDSFAVLAEMRKSRVRDRCAGSGARASRTRGIFRERAPFRDLRTPLLSRGEFVIQRLRFVTLWKLIRRERITPNVDVQ